MALNSAFNKDDNNDDGDVECDDCSGEEVMEENDKTTGVPKS